MKKTKSMHKTALPAGKFSASRHPMAKIAKEAPRKAKLHSLRKGTAKSGKAGH